MRLKLSGIFYVFKILHKSIKGVIGVREMGGGGIETPEISVIT